MSELKIQVTGATPEEKLDSIGIEQIVNMITSGVRLRTHGHSKKPGLLNTIDVEEQDFINWMATQGPDAQNKYADAVRTAGSNITTDLLYQSVDVIEEIDEMIETIGDRGPTKTNKWKLQLLESKHKLCTDSLRQLVQIQKIKAETQPQESLPPPGPAPSGSVTMSDEQRKQIEAMKGKKKDG